MTDTVVAVDASATATGQPTRTPAAGSRLLEHGWWPIVLWAVGLFMGGRALSDTSFLTHLATGRVIRSAGAPHADVFTFASRGAHLVVQSWLASWTYASLEAVGGAAAIRVFVAVVTATLLALLWRLSIPAGSLIGRLALVSLAGVVGLLWWNERPQIIAFVLLAGVAVVVAERRSAWWLVAIFAVWVNVHGSFPLGLLYLGLAVAVRVIDERRISVDAVAAVAAAVAGVVIGAVLSPYGLELATFPLHMAGRSAQLVLISEWRPLAFGDLSAVVFIGEVCAIGALLVMQRAWMRFVVGAVFVALALIAVRNVAVASLVLIPVAAPCMAGLGSFQPGPAMERRRLIAAVAAVSLVALSWIAASPDYDLDPYPVAAVDWMDAHHLAGRDGVRVLTHDYDGAYLEWRYGTHANTWLDDRAEVHSFETTRDYVLLLSAIGRPGDILARHPHEIVLWSSGTPVAAFLERSPQYRMLYRDDRAVVACRLGGNHLCPA